MKTLYLVRSIVDPMDSWDYGVCLHQYLILATTDKEKANEALKEAKGEYDNRAFNCFPREFDIREFDIIEVELDKYFSSFDSDIPGLGGASYIE